MEDEKKGKLRFVDNVFPHKGYIWNYGAIPQVPSSFLRLTRPIDEPHSPVDRRGRTPIT